MTLSLFIKCKAHFVEFFYPGTQDLDNFDQFEPETDDPFEQWPILKFYREGDSIVSNLTEGSKKRIKNASRPNINGLKYEDIEFQFLGMPNERMAVVFDGRVQDEDPEENPEKVYEKPIESIMGPYVNPAAMIRKRKMEGAETYCKLQNSDFDHLRKEKHRERMKLKAGDAMPCDAVEDTVEKIQPPKSVG